MIDVLSYKFEKDHTVLRILREEKRKRHHQSGKFRRLRCYRPANGIDCIHAEVRMTVLNMQGIDKAISINRDF